VLHLAVNVDYTYHFGLSRFSVLDHFYYVEHYFIMQLMISMYCNDIDNTLTYYIKT